MAIGDPYATVGELSARLGSEDTVTFPDLLDVASRAVESFTGRQFNKAATPTVSARRFRPLDPYRLPVDDFHTITGLVVDVNGTVWDNATVDPQPWGGLVNGQTGWPFFNLFAKNRIWPFDATILVTADWGWPAVPAAVKQATLDVAAVRYNSGGSSQEVRSMAIDGFSETYVVNGGDVPPEMEALKPYRRKRFGIA